MTQPIAVFDCVIYAQALMSGRGPASSCLKHVLDGNLQLVWSDYVLQEIRELPSKLPLRFLVTSERVEAFIASVAPVVRHISLVPDVYTNPFDKDDSHYVNLAVASGAKLITSRDGDLLRLMDASRSESQEFRSRFPEISILTPEQLLVVLQPPDSESA